MNHKKTEIDLIIEIMSTAEPCQAESQTAFQCTQIQGPEVCSCFDASTFTTQLKQDISQAYMSTLAFVAPFDPTWCKASDESICQIAAAKHSCCCLTEVDAYRKCLVETVLPTEASVTVKCQHSCQKNDAERGGGGSGGVIGTVIGVLLLLVVLVGSLWFWRRRRLRAANTVGDHHELGEKQVSSKNRNPETLDNSKQEPRTGLMGRLFRTKREADTSPASPTKSCIDSIHKSTDLETGNSSSSPPEESGNDMQLPPSIQSGPSTYQRMMQPSKAAQQTDDSSSFSSDYSSHRDDDDDDESSDDGTEMLKMINTGTLKNKVTSPPKFLDKEEQHVAGHFKPPNDMMTEASTQKQSTRISLHKADISAHPPIVSSREAEARAPKTLSSSNGVVQGSESSSSEQESNSDDESWDSSKQHTISKTEELKKKRTAIESWNKDQKKGSSKSLQAYMSGHDESYHKDTRGRHSSSRSFRDDKECRKKPSSFITPRPGSQQSSFRLQESPQDHKTAKAAPVITTDEAELEEDRKLTAQRILQLEEKNKILQYDLEKACEEEEARKRREAMTLQERRNQEEIRKEKEMAALRIAELEEQNRRLQRKLEQKTSSRKLQEEVDKEDRRRLRKERKERAESARLSEYYRLTSKGGKFDFEKRSLSCDDRSVKKRLDSDDW